MKRFLIILFLIMVAGCAGMKHAHQFYAEKNYQAAVTECQRALEKDSLNAEAHLILGQSLRQLNNMDQAVKSFQLASRIKPESAIARRAKSELIDIKLYLADETKKNQGCQPALSRYKEILGLDSTNFRANYQLALCYEENHWLEKARFYFAAAQRQQPEEIKIEQKISALDSLTQLALDRFERGLKFYQQNKNKSAAQLLKETLAIKADFPDAQYYYHLAQGKILYQKGSKSQLWDAIEEFGKAMMLREDAAEPHVNLARAYEKKDREEFDNAIEEYQIALEKEPEGPWAKQCKYKIKQLTDQRDKLKKFWGK